MKTTIITILSSLLKTISVSAAIGGIAFFFGNTFWLWALVSMVAQYVIFYLYGSYVEYKAAQTLKEHKLKELEILSRITVPVNCAACKHPNEVVITTIEGTRFECTQCAASNSVYISAEAALVTTPIASNITE